MTSKRLLDLAIAALCVTLAVLPITAIAIAIRVLNGNPIFFRQLRFGKNGLEFGLYKFRTMKTRPAAESGTFDVGDVSRVTRLGRILRKTKLDELPQLLNVIKGDMSLVGPRPEVRKWVEAYPDQWAEVLTVRPGITDPASIEFRNEEELLQNAASPEEYYRNVILPRKLELYKEYVRTQSLWQDINIIFKTCYAVIAGIFHKRKIG